MAEDTEAENSEPSQDMVPAHTDELEKVEPEVVVTSVRWNGRG